MKKILHQEIDKLLNQEPISVKKVERFFICLNGCRHLYDLVVTPLFVGELNYSQLLVVNQQVNYVYGEPVREGTQDTDIDMAWQDDKNIRKIVRKSNTCRVNDKYPSHS